VFARFTEHARQVVVLAQDEARALGHDQIGTEHLLLALLWQEGTLARQALRNLGVSFDRARGRIVELVGSQAESPSGAIPFTPHARRALELSLPQSFGHGGLIWPEHILVALARTPKSVAAHVLLEFGLDADKVEREISRLRAESSGEHAPRPR
jgi:ATP-dependent Clp protease ATP-binding subunit ClpC